RAQHVIERVGGEEQRVVGDTLTYHVVKLHDRVVLLFQRRPICGINDTHYLLGHPRLLRLSTVRSKYAAGCKPLLIHKTRGDPPRQTGGTCGGQYTPPVWRG